VTLDWLAIGISSFALLVSGLSYFGMRTTRRREWRIEAGKVAAEIGLALASVISGADQTKRQWHAMLAARGTYQSGMRETFDNQIDRKIADAESLRQRLGQVHHELDRKSDEQLETAIVQLRGLQLQAQALTDWFDQKNNQHSTAVDEQRRNAESRAR